MDKVAMTYCWETIADQLSAAGWSWGYVTAITPNGTLHIVDAHRDDGHRFIVRSEEKLAAFLELERTLRAAVR